MVGVFPTELGCRSGNLLKNRKIIAETATEGLNLKISKISYHNSHPNRSATQKFVTMFPTLLFSMILEK
jgi:hypothetical protein